MKQAVTAKERILNLIENIRRDFHYEDPNYENTSIKWWDICILCFVGYFKEIIELFLNTFTSYAGFESFSPTWPVCSPFFWTLVLKTLFGGLLLIYFGFRINWAGYSSTAGWYIVLFMSWALLRDTIVLLSPEIWGIVHSALLPFLYFWFFFVKDRRNINDLKMFFYRQEDLYDGGFGRGLMKNPNAKVSGKKVERAIYIILSFFLTAIAIIFIVENIIRKIKGGEEAPPPKNQGAIKRGFAKNWPLISLSAIIKAPIVEELIFRRCIFGLSNNGMLPVLLSSFFFALMHLKQESMLFIIPYIITGFLFSLLMKICKNIWFSSFLHGFWNFCGIIKMLIELLGGSST